MIKMVFNVIKSIFSLIFSIFRPLKRLWCRRMKSSEMDPGIPALVTSHSLTIDMPASAGNTDDADIEMESWDTWDSSQSVPAQTQHSQSSAAYYQNQHIRGRKLEPEPEPEPEPDYFQDMTPEVKRPAKIVLKKKDNGTVNTSAISTRLSVMGVAPPVNSELQTWDDQTENAWGEELMEDLSWEAEAALREKRRMERENRTLEQQKKKQQRDAMRGLKKDSHLAVKIS